MLKRLVQSIASLVLLAVMTAGIAWVWATDRYQTPSATQDTVRIDIPRGSGLSRIGQILASHHLINSNLDPWVFTAMVKQSNRGGSLQAGEYDVPPHSSMADITDMLTSGKNRVHYSLTIPEGLTSPEVMRLIQAMPQLDGPLSLRPETGSLLPETYAFLRGDRRDEAIHRMQTALTKALDELWPNRDPNLPIKSKEEAIILASVVEKETALASERPRVAAVFINRLRLGMPLQSDPTVIYGLAPDTGSIARPLLRADLEKDHPWNTYTRNGLPLSPIANPGLESLRAVLHPARTKDLYFVADGSGGHAFAATLNDHNRNVTAWRKLQRQ